MKHIEFYNSFRFFLVDRQRYHHTDNSTGIPCHFLARMRCGTARIVTEDGQELSLTAGDVFYLPLGLRYHSYWYGDPENGNRVSWESYSFEMLPEREDSLSPMVFTEADAAVNALLDCLSAQMTVSSLSVGLLYQALGLLLPKTEKRHGTVSERRAARAKEFIEAHPDFQVSELARYCDMSESGIYAFFRRELGTTPLGLRNKMKVRRATALLEETDLSVEEIATRLGYGNAAYFRHIFREVTGKTPSAVRRAAKLI